MRVNVYIELISKTLMNGLKVFSKFNKSNKRKSLEYYLKFNKIIKETLATTLLKSSTLKLAVATIASALVVLIEICLNIIGFCRLTVLMNDFRLKTFYCKLSKQPTTSSSSKTTLTFLSTTSSSTATTSESSSLTITSSNNNHNRTYNNSSKSNKVFLYYTPRDPRLRIFLKTKHFNRPVVVQSQFNNLSFSSKKVFNNRSLFKITDDLCNYGELIGGGVNNINCNISNNSNCSNYKNCAVNKTRKLIVIKKFNSANSLNKKNNNKTTIICDNLIETSDNCVVAAAAAVINIVNIFIIIVVVIKYTEELFNYIKILLSLNNHQQLKVQNVKIVFGLYENIF